MELRDKSDDEARIVNEVMKLDRVPHDSGRITVRTKGQSPVEDERISGFPVDLEDMR